MSLEPTDVLEILQLVTRADDRASARDADGYVALFAEDAVMDGDMGRAEGRTELAAAVARVWAAEPVGHTPGGWRISVRTINTRG